MKPSRRSIVVLAALAGSMLGTAYARPDSDLPVPPGSDDVPRPSGPVGNLKVLDWAGFKGAISYTFDDALDSQIQNFETLSAPRVPMTFYLNDHTATALTEAEREAAFRRWLRHGNELGDHTAWHCHISGAGIVGGDPAEQPECAWTPDNLPIPGTTPEKEIGEVATWIRTTLGQRGVWTMASPYGDADWDPFAKEAGFIVHRDVFQGFLSPNDLTNQYHLPVFICGAPQFGGLDDQEASFDQVIDKARADGTWGLFLFHQVGPATDSIGCCEVPAANIVGSMEHMKSLRDVWGDTVVHVAAYWIGQALVTNATQTTHGRSTTFTWTLPPNFPRHRFVRVTVTGGDLRQDGRKLHWDGHGYYEVALDTGSLTLTP